MKIILSKKEVDQAIITYIEETTSILVSAKDLSVRADVSDWSNGYSINTYQVEVDTEREDIK